MNYLLEVVEEGTTSGSKIGMLWIVAGVILLAMLVTVIIIVVNDKKKKK